MRFWLFALPIPIIIARIAACTQPVKGRRGSARPVGVPQLRAGSDVNAAMRNGSGGAALGAHSRADDGVVPPQRSGFIGRFCLLR